MKIYIVEVMSMETHDTEWHSAHVARERADAQRDPAERESKLYEPSAGVGEIDLDVAPLLLDFIAWLRTRGVELCSRQNPKSPAMLIPVDHIVYTFEPVTPVLVADFVKERP